MPADPPGFEIGKDGIMAVVAGVDGSPSSLHAAAWAGGLARRETALLVLVYVEPLGSPAYWSPLSMAGASQAAVDYVEELRGEAQRYLDPIGVHWKLVHHRGDPASGLESVAEQFRADCIVVGRSRHGGGLLGSVPRTLINDAARPVVVVP